MIKPIKIIPFLDIKNRLLIKGINYEVLRVLGNPKDFANLWKKIKNDWRLRHTCNKDGADD